MQVYRKRTEAAKKLYLKQLATYRANLLAKVGRSVHSLATCSLSATEVKTRSSAIAERPRDASCQLKFCQLPRNSAETTCTTSPEPSISCR